MIAFLASAFALGMLFNSAIGWSFAPPPPPVYCASNGANQYWEYIDYVAIGTIARTSGAEAGGYYDGSAISTDVVQGDNYTVTFSHANPHGGYVETWVFYIDWNADGDFTDAGETALTAVTYTAANYTGTIAVPSSATLGAVRMRVSMGSNFYPAPPACGTFQYGEVEDCTLNVVPATVCTESYEPNNTKAKAKPIVTETDVTSQISTATDLDWFSFSNTMASPNMQITLTALPADYNLKLANPSGVVVKQSKKTGTTDEKIIYNTATTGTWKVEVYGVNGAYSNTQCYTLHVSTSSTPYFVKEEEAESGRIAELMVYPVPATDQLTISFSSESAQPMQFRIINASGIVMESGVVQVNDGINQVIADVSTYAAGIYLVEVRTGNAIQHQKFQVIR